MSNLQLLSFSVLSVVSVPGSWQAVPDDAEKSALAKPVVVKDLPDDGGIGDVALSSKAGLLAIGGGKGRIRFWDVKSQKLLLKFVEHPTGGIGSLRALAFSRDGKRLASVDTWKTGSLCVWDVESKKLLWQDDRLRYGNRVAFAPDCKSVVALDFCKVRVFHVETGKLLHEADIDPGFSSYLAFSLDGKLLITAGKGFDSVIVWDFATLKRQTRPKCGGPVQSICFGKGQLVLVGSWNQPVRALDVSKDEIPADLTEKIKGYVDDLHISRELDVVVTIERNSGSLHIFDLGTGKKLAHFARATVFRTTIAEDGKTLATGQGNTVELWDLPALIKKTDQR